jgi:hypothetical protein
MDPAAGYLRVQARARRALTVFLVLMLGALGLFLLLA